MRHKTSIIHEASKLSVGAQPEEIDDILALRLTALHLRPGQRSIKRLLDILGSICLLILMGPAIVLAAILVRLTSAGPILYTQTRAGAGGKEFTLYKFRTMIPDAERKTGPVLAARRDPRITLAGRFLRALHIDELPQLFNVLLGGMSLVGPRPERPHFVKINRARLPDYELRMAVRPGITGLAQISCRYSTSPEEKLRFDLMYISNYSLLMDIQIFFETILAVLQPGYSRGFGGRTVSPAELDEELAGSDPRNPQ